MNKMIEISVASCSAFGECNLVVDVFENAMGQTGLDEVDNAVPMQNERFGKGLEGRGFGGIHLGAPLRQELSMAS